MLLWREIAIKRGYRSSITLPLKDQDGNIFGSLHIYSTEVNVFTPPEIKLLDQLAADLAFGITSLRIRAERKRAEEALLEERKLFIGGPNVAFIWKAAEGWPVEYVSPNVVEQFGYHPEDFTSGRVSYAGIVHPHDVVRIAEESKLAGESGVPCFDQEYRIACADGEYRWVYDFTVLTRDSNGAVTHFRGYINDITARKRAEKALRHSEFEKSIFNEIANVFLTISDEDMYDGVLAIVLRAIQSPFGIFGYLSEEGDLVLPSLSRSIWERCQMPGKCTIFPASTWKDTVWGKSMREMKTLCSHGPFRTPEGHLSIESFITVPIVYGSETIGQISLANKEGGYSDRDRDLLERIATYISPILNARLQRHREERTRLAAQEEVGRLNAELEQRVRDRTLELESANKELESFSYSVSHDLRAPLRHVSGFVRLLSSHASDALDEKGRHYLDVIEESAVQMGKLIDDVLSFSRMSRTELVKTRVRIQDLLTEVLQMVEHDLQGRDIEWRVAALPEVYGSREMLRIVLANLVSNALKFTGGRAKAVIEIGYIADPDEDICFVRDNGAGFDMRYVDKLFGLFQRLHSTGEFEGTGLGLANVRRIVRRHGGRTWAEGVVDEGATVYFSLPKA